MCLWYNDFFIAREQENMFMFIFEMQIKYYENYY